MSRGDATFTDARRSSGRGARGFLPDADFRRMVDETKQRYDITEVAARTRKVVKAGREMKALCAFHDERSPSMRLSNAKGTFHCFGCGASGDIVTYVMRTEALTFLDALRWLGAELPPVDPASRAKAIAEDAAARAEAIADARMMWSECVSIEGTPGEEYLRVARGLSMDFPESVRFGHVPTSRDPETGQWRRPYPAVVCCCTDGADEVVGLQRVFLRDDGSDKRWGKKSKFSLGRPKSAAFKIGGTAEEILLCEGPEDGLSLSQELQTFPVWVALGTAMMPELDLPPKVKRLLIAGQNDAAGRVAVTAAAVAFADRGIAVRQMFPEPAFKDWNDQLRGVRI